MHVSAAEALEDLDVLVRNLRDAHPHPYPDGMPAFYASVAECVAGIPDDGLPVAEFRRLLRPVLAAVRDGHTRLLVEVDVEELRFPVGWDVVEDILYVARVGDEDQRGLLGARLVSVNGRTVAELRAAYTGIRGCDNRSQELTGVALALGAPLLAADLLGASEGLKVSVRTVAGVEVTIDLRPAGGPVDWIGPPTSMELPPADASGLGWGFLPDGTVYLRVANLVGYRENLEMMASITGQEPGPLSGATSATDLLRDLVTSARAVGAGRLLVDLRGNGGGSAAFVLIIGYYLRGLEFARRVDLGYSVTRYSELFAERYPAMVTDVPAEVWAAGGYDFREEHEYRAGDLAESFPLQNHSPSFAAELARGDLSASWSPEMTCWSTRGPTVLGCSWRCTCAGWAPGRWACRPRRPATAAATC